MRPSDEYSPILCVVPDALPVVDHATRIPFVTPLRPGCTGSAVPGSPAGGDGHPDHRADFVARFTRTLDARAANGQHMDGARFAEDLPRASERRATPTSMPEAC